MQCQPDKDGHQKDSGHLNEESCTVCSNDPAIHDLKGSAQTQTTAHRIQAELNCSKPQKMPSEQANQ